MTNPTPTAEQIEAVARAICAHHGTDPDERLHASSLKAWQLSEDVARVAFIASASALPTHPVEEGLRELVRKYRSNADILAPRGIRQDMVDWGKIAADFREAADAITRLLGDPK